MVVKANSYLQQQKNVKLQSVLLSIHIQRLISRSETYWSTAITAENWNWKLVR